MRNSGKRQPRVMTQVIATKTFGSVTGLPIPTERPAASIAASAAGTSYWIAPMTESRIHGRTYPRATERTITVMAILIAGAIEKTALDVMVFLI